MSVHARWIRQLVVAVSVLAVGLIVGSLVIGAPPAKTGSAVVVDPGEDVSWRARSAYASTLRSTCCTGLAEHYAGQLRSSERAMAAYSARLAGLAEQVVARNDGLKSGPEPWAIVIAAKEDPKRRGIPDAMLIEEDALELRKFVAAVKGSGEYT